MIVNNVENVPSMKGLEKLDNDKQIAIKRIWQTRPIYALQGPPGTGKTTMIANLLRMILQEDPVCQILVTAQAHEAVDVLRKSVDKLFTHYSPNDKPIAIRLARKTNKKSHIRDKEPDGSSLEVTKSIVKDTIKKLNKLGDQKGLQKRWHGMLNEILELIKNGSEGESCIATDFKKLVERSANITYCSTTAGDLAQLATSHQTFDWSIIEEAGKAHGFELVLPMQTGHRWILIGDHEQLRPYRWYDFKNMVDALENAMDALYDLSAGGRLLDRDLIRDWKRSYTPEEKNERIVECNKRLWMFKSIFNSSKTCDITTAFKWCESEYGKHTVKELMSSQYRGLAYKLGYQHRMHPDIADIISNAFYDGSIISATKDSSGKIDSNVLHPFIYPKIIKNKSIVWIDVPWEKGSNCYGQYTSDRECSYLINFLLNLRCSNESKEKLSLAVLSPYRRQVQKILTKRIPKEFYNNKPDWLDDGSLRIRGI